MNTNPNTKRILIYGDSLTWGRIPNQFARFDSETRYTGILQNELGSGYEVVEEGLRSRMVKGENPHTQNRNGFQQFAPILASHLTVDILVIFLGTNATNKAAAKTPGHIVDDLEDYLPKISEAVASMGMEQPQTVVFVAPPRVDDDVLDMFEGATKKSEAIPVLLQDMAVRNDCLFFDASKVANPSKLDGVHLDEKNNMKLGKALAEFVNNLY